MGLYQIDCVNESCKQPFMWFSGNLSQFCEKCSKKEDASTNSLGAVPNGRLVNKKQKPIKKLINPLKVEGESMSLAKKYLGILFEEEPTDMPAGDDAPPPDAVDPDAPVDGDADPEVDPEEQKEAEFVAACAELAELANAMEDGEDKDKLMAISAKFDAMKEPVEDPEAEDDMDVEVDPDAPAEEPAMEEPPMESKVYPWTKRE